MKKIISGKVRDVYDIGEDRLVIVTTDRISAFDVVLPTPIPGKGAVLNQVSSFWFRHTGDLAPNHMLSEALSDMPAFFQEPQYENRAILVKRLRMLPYEFVVRGYMFGNMWNSYQKSPVFCGYELESGYRQAERLRAPILTPSTKSTEGHDVYITMDALRDGLGAALTAQLEDVCLKIYARCYEYALTRGIIIADTKFEFGLDGDGAVTLADEALTPDSSRFWNAETYAVGISPKSYDKQFIRDFLIARGLDGVTPPPEIPDDIVQATAGIYRECLTRLTSPASV